jgi:hypothetical protein
VLTDSVLDSSKKVEFRSHPIGALRRPYGAT